ncbi:MAG: NAD(+)/NADH kinase [Lachnospiraceae bacterium]|nr:NAD(+)/NADH kinase [Lachnospiraceae bacterium]
MKHFYLIANPRKEGTREAAEQISEYLKAHGACCAGSAQLRKTAGNGQGYTDVSQIPSGTECVITLGGDGTLIQASRDLVSLQLPMIGINMGNLGYLTQVGRDEALEPMLDALLQDHFTLERRMMLEGRVMGPDGEKRGIALNDIVLTRKDVLQVIRFQLFLNGQYFNEYTADGVIAATPTGSTAYNLSAGGPLVIPGAELMVLTPICSHSLNARSIVLSSKDRVSIRLIQQEGRQQTAVFDGDQVLDLGYEDTLEISRAENYTTLIQLKNASFLETLRNKIVRV